MQEVRDGVNEIALCAIQDRFEAIDSDGNQAIDYSEFASWQLDMGSQALSDATAPAVSRAMVPGSLPFDPGDDAEARAMRLLIEPLNPAGIAQADADFDGKVSLAELQTHQRRNFTKFDANNDGNLTMLELEDARETALRGRV